MSSESEVLRFSAACRLLKNLPTFLWSGAEVVDYWRAHNMDLFLSSRSHSLYFLHCRQGGLGRPQHEWAAEITDRDRGYFPEKLGCALWLPGPLKQLRGSAYNTWCYHIPYPHLGSSKHNCHNRTCPLCAFPQHLECRSIMLVHETNPANQESFDSSAACRLPRNCFKAYNEGLSSLAEKRKVLAIYLIFYTFTSGVFRCRMPSLVHRLPYSNMYELS